MPSFRTITASLLLVLASATGQAAERVINDEQLLQQAERLVKLYPDADPMVIEHARRLVAGEPVKTWKNCLIEQTLLQEQARTPLSAGR